MKKLIILALASLTALSLFGCQSELAQHLGDQILNEVVNSVIEGSQSSSKPEQPSASDSESIEIPETGEKTTASLVRVVDGDTIIVLLDGEELRVRLIGIDTPESVHSDESKNTEAGDIASDYTKNLLPKGAELTLEYDVEMYDRYDRVLAYVWYGDLFVNAHLVEEGYAIPKAYEPNTKYKDYFESLAP